MTFWAKRLAATSALIAANLMLFSCASGPRPPEKGTPAFYWAAARESYETGDYLKTIDNLERVAATENEFAAAARPWLLVLTSGLTRGHIEIADYFEGGARVHKADPTAFRRHVSQNRNAAGRMSLRFAELFAEFQKSGEDPVTLSFPFPTGSGALVGALVKAGNGILPAPAEIDTGIKTAIMRAVLLATSRAAGCKDDTAKAREMFKTGEAKIPRAQFMMAMAGNLNESAQLYGRNKLDDPQKLDILAARAEDALKAVPDSKDKKELLLKIQTLRKQSKR